MKSPILIVVIAASGYAASTPARPGQDDKAQAVRLTETGSDADPVGRTLREIEARFESRESGDSPGSLDMEEKSFEIDEASANKYLRRRAASDLREGISNPWIRFENDLAIVGARVDLDELKKEMPDNMIIRFLSGKVPVEITARVQSNSGSGRIVLERIILSGIELPASFVQELALKHGTGGFLPEGFQLGESFSLPYALSEIRLAPRSLEIVQRGSGSASR